MKPRKLIWQLFPSFLGITILAILAISIACAIFFKSFFLDQVKNDLETRAYMVSGQITNSLLSGDIQSIQTICREIGKKSSTRITVILPSGKVIGDSWENPDTMDNHLSRPEIAQALEKKIGISIRFSRTIERNMMYIAIPIMDEGKLIALLRTSVSLKDIEEMYRKILNQIIMIGVIISLISTGICLFISRRIVRPIEELKLSAERFANGELTHKIYVDSSSEFQALADTMNVMADQLNKRIDQIMRQKNELQTVLTSMREGVLAINSDEYIISANHAAAAMFDKQPSQMINRTIQEVIRNPDLHKLVKRALSGDDQAEEDIVFYHQQEQIINIHCTRLLDPKNNPIGILVVLNDVTRLRRLETIRKDFATNVSHEIKTPLTAIKGFVETLQSGAIKEPDKAQRFLDIIEKHVDRLNAVVNDLMELSRLEQTGKTQSLQKQDVFIQDILKNAIQLCQPGIENRRIQIQMECDPKLQIRINPDLMEHAVKNLIENAVNYSEEGGMVCIIASIVSNEIQISVKDFGIGIDKEHLSRIFERFYRVDKSRSRKQGGTGLGLSIVKHIVQAHGGYVTVESTLGKGSTFTIHLPLPQPNVLT